MRVSWLIYEWRPKSTDETIQKSTPKKAKQTAKIKVKRKQVSDSGSEIEV